MSFDIGEPKENLQYRIKIDLFKDIILPEGGQSPVFILRHEKISSLTNFSSKKYSIVKQAVGRDFIHLRVEPQVAANGVSVRSGHFPCD